MTPLRATWDVQAAKRNRRRELAGSFPLSALQCSSSARLLAWGGAGARSSSSQGLDMLAPPLHIRPLLHTRPRRPPRPRSSRPIREAPRGWTKKEGGSLHDAGSLSAPTATLAEAESEASTTAASMTCTLRAWLLCMESGCLSMRSAFSRFYKISTAFERMAVL